MEDYSPIDCYLSHPRMRVHLVFSSSQGFDDNQHDLKDGNKHTPNTTKFIHLAISATQRLEVSIVMQGK